MRSIRRDPGVARVLLMLSDDFGADAWRLDVDLAERFAAPLDDVCRRRRERSDAST